MAYVCDICEKRTMTGNSQKHRRGIAGKRWKKRAQTTSRLFKPNLQNVSLKINGESKKMKICTNCLKRVKKFGKIKGYSSISV